MELPREVKPQGSSLLRSATCSIRDFVKIELRTVPPRLALRPLASRSQGLPSFQIKKIHALGKRGALASAIRDAEPVSAALSENRRRVADGRVSLYKEFSLSSATTLVETATSNMRPVPKNLYMCTRRSPTSDERR
jgi:hypothetical protein